MVSEPEDPSGDCIDVGVTELDMKKIHADGRDILAQKLPSMAVALTQSSYTYL